MKSSSRLGVLCSTMRAQLCDVFLGLGKGAVVDDDPFFSVSFAISDASPNESLPAPKQREGS